MIKEKLIGLSYGQKRSLQIVADVLLMWAALWLAFVIRLGPEGWLLPTSAQAWLFLLAPLVSLPVYIRMGMYRAVMRYFGNDALRCIFRAVTTASVGLVVVVVALRMAGVDVFRSRSILFMYWCLSLGMLGGLRLVAREYFTGNWFTAGKELAHDLMQKEQAGKPIAIYGAGEAGNQLLASIKVGRLYKPVAFVDDNPALARRTVSGLPVFSATDIDRLIDSTGAEELFLAIPSATRAHRKQVLANLQQFPLHVRTIPGLCDIASGKVKVDDLQEVDIADLLGRDAVPPEASLFEGCIKGKAVMVTGAGGSIGSELCRQIITSRPTTLVLFEHSEFALYAIHSELDNFLKTCDFEVTLVPILGSIRNSTRLRHVISAWNIKTIYHAAAYKHVPLVEHNVAEGIMNNVFGTLNVAQAAIRCQVENFVLISTDKAVRPTNVMGSTKRMAELVLQGLSAEQAPNLWNADPSVKHLNRTRFSMVRFGNVLGSSGSVIPLFRNQIRLGGPITVTHEKITRYFMTIPEAAQLVIQAGAMGEGGDVFVLDMGEPVNIVDLAKKMIQLSGLSVKDEQNPNGDIEIAFTGLRPGEKLYEELLIGDNPQETAHPKIRKANEALLPWSELLPILNTIRQAVRDDDYDTIRELLLHTVQGYTPSNGIVDLLYEHHRRAVD
ncbi:nucleoside-diphosphate sugar epimerase/dehydratase [Pseudomonas sp. OIL-1]|uniref:polysaccharide biosynthesis protein n=1 Tax=Pseudomonas sp. OIL-1 TaxID=2706126 RepID=UPI0013A78B4E|nr:nucleoside-diphosphate sugar epimerase/dehydratase [Pseudomonas sp. OIL-1]QIB52591.1 polysaccharide biosynthesis protein [Pseudomonas sp. OIL-1]